MAKTSLAHARRRALKIAWGGSLAVVSAIALSQSSAPAAPICQDSPEQYISVLHTNLLYCASGLPLNALKNNSARCPITVDLTHGPDIPKRMVLWPNQRENVGCGVHVVAAQWSDASEMWGQWK